MAYRSELDAALARIAVLESTRARCAACDRRRQIGIAIAKGILGILLALVIVAFTLAMWVAMLPWPPVGMG